MTSPAPQGSEGKDLSTRDNFANNIQFTLVDVIKYAFSLSTLDLLRISARISTISEEEQQTYLNYLLSGDIDSLKAAVLQILNDSGVAYSADNFETIFNQVKDVATCFVDLANSGTIEARKINSLGTLIKNAEFVGMQHYSQINLCYYME